MKRLAVAAVAALGLFGCSGSTGPEQDQEAIELKSQFSSRFRIILEPMKECMYGIGDNMRGINSFDIAMIERRDFIPTFEISYAMLDPNVAWLTFADTVLTTESGKKVKAPYIKIDFAGFRTATFYPEIPWNNKYASESDDIPCSYKIRATDKYVEYSYDIKRKHYIVQNPPSTDTLASYEGGITIRMYYHLSDDQTCGIRPIEHYPMHVIRMPQIKLYEDASWFKEMAKDSENKEYLEVLDLFLKKSKQFENTTYIDFSR